MSALTDRFDQSQAQGRATLIGYFPLGFPSLATSLDTMQAMVEGGVDVVEIGIPYSDPVLDGPVIQQASAIALEAGARIEQVCEAARVVKAAGAVPLAMSYFNPLVQYGLERFCEDFSHAGGAGVITPDLTPDAAGSWGDIASSHGLDTVYLVAPSSTPERLALTAAASRGFVYAASVMGVTGARSSVGVQAKELVTRTRAAGAARVCVGLGVSTQAHAAEVAEYADGVIAGSVFVKCIDPDGDDAAGIADIRATAAALAAGVRGES